MTLFLRRVSETVKVEVLQPQEVDIRLDEQETEVCVMSEIVTTGGGDLPWYNGAYEVTPRAYNEQVLQTAQKSMREDVVVHKVPRYDVDNPFGGQTISIATEV